MRFSLRVVCLLALFLHLTSCATGPSSEEGGGSEASSELQEFGENEFNGGDSGGDSSGSEQASASNAQEEDLTLDEGAQPAEDAVGQETASLEEELTLDEDKESEPPEDLQAFEEPPLEQPQAEPPPPEVAQEPPPPAVEPPAPPPAVETVRVTDLQFLASEKGGTVLIKTSGPAHYSTRRNEAENQYVVEIENATLPDQFKRPYITKEFNSSIASINAYQDKGSSTSRFVIQMRDATELGVQQDGVSLMVAATGAAPAAPVAQTPPPPVEDVGNDETVAATGSSTFDEFLTGETKFYGRRINIEVTDEDVRNVFNLIAEESGANLVLDDKVTGPITVKLRQVPWDQALVVVMKAKGLGYVRQGNVLRIAPLDTLKKESDTAREIVESRQKVDPLKVKVIPVSYANVEDLVKQTEKFLSARGKVGADNRTSSIVITDTAETIERLTRLIKTLDVSPDQVLIEGKIVEAKDSFSREVGVKWGASGNPVALGNSPSGLPVNLTPSAAYGSGKTLSPLGMNLNLNIGTLDVLGELSATLALYEKEEVVKVISSPRVVTMNREKSTISQSDQQPIQQITQTGNTPTISYRYEPAELKLEVQPQITPEGGVIMDINVKREFFGAAILAGGPPKFTREAKTRVLVRTGQTAVIGGIYNNTQTEGEEGVPGLRKIPVLGWLFKSRTRSTDKNELIIFLTPRILGKNDTSPQGGVQ